LHSLLLVRLANTSPVRMFRKPLSAGQPSRLCDLGDDCLVAKISGGRLPGRQTQEAAQPGVAGVDRPKRLLRSALFGVKIVEHLVIPGQWSASKLFSTRFKRQKCRGVGRLRTPRRRAVTRRPPSWVLRSSREHRQLVARKPHDGHPLGYFASVSRHHATWTIGL